jgi:hypothetical protein
MPPLRYHNGDIIKQGDRVSLRRSLRPDLVGQVIYVYDPMKPFIPTGENEYGFSVRLADNRERWYGGEDASVRLLARRD